MAVLADLYFVTGGVRSGKSAFAERLISSFAGESVTYLATLSASDDEMVRRIARHKAARPKGWVTVEEAFDLSGVIASIRTKGILLDCLSGWVSNLIIRHEHLGEEALTDQILPELENLLVTIRETNAVTVIVSNEVGSGVVPPYPLGRYFRDALGLANQQVAASAIGVALCTVGIAQPLKGTFPDV